MRTAYFQNPEAVGRQGMRLARFAVGLIPCGEGGESGSERPPVGAEDFATHGVVVHVAEP